MAEPKIKCAYTKLVPIEELKPHPDNPNQHTEEQIAHLAKLIKKRGVRKPITVSNRSGFITAGHGRLRAFEKVGLKMVPVDFQDYDSEADEYADLVADNAIAQWASIDLSWVNAKVPSLGDDFDVDMLGLKDFVYQPESTFDPNTNDGTSGLTDEEVDVYTKKVESPLYEPKGTMPKVGELYDRAKTNRLITEIENADDISDEVKTFLINAAYRHTVFSYDRIAEFYSHASPEVQDLMEKSALVIIDFKKAISEGFVALSKDIAELYPVKEEDEAEDA